MSKKRLARAISKFFDPLLVLPAVTLWVFLWAVNSGLDWQKMLTVLLIDTVPVIAVLIGAVQKQGLKDWDIHNRQWRVPILLTALGMQMFGIWLVISWGYLMWAQLLTGLAGITAVYLLVTLKWRVSIHVGVMATLATLGVIFGGWSFTWLYGLTGLVAWARVVGHDHTLGQTVAGGFIPPAALILTLLVVS